MANAPTRPPLEDLAHEFERHANSRMPVADSTIRAYVFWVRDFTAWLATEEKRNYLEAVTDEVAAKQAVRAYRHHLLTKRKLAPKSVDAAITAVGALYSYFGMQRPKVQSATPRGAADPKSLDEDQVRDVLRAAERRPGMRDYALIHLMYASGLRIGEVHMLDRDDLELSDRKGKVIVRAGKGDKPREVPLEFHASISVLNKWVHVRRDEFGMPNGEGPLWVTSKNQRLALRSIRHVVYRVGAAAGVELTPHTLRHTYGRTMLDKGHDIVTVANLMGHSSVNTTMGYVASRQSHREAAAASLTIDY